MSFLYDINLYLFKLGFKSSAEKKMERLESLSWEQIETKYRNLDPFIDADEATWIAHHVTANWIMGKLGDSRAMQRKEVDDGIG